LAPRRSGTIRRGRNELQTILDFLRPGDVLMVALIDRLAQKNWQTVQYFNGRDNSWWRAPAESRHL
jgi:DNA invertase Pin-like site-specific DNA recombinase